MVNFMLNVRLKGQIPILT